MKGKDNAPFLALNRNKRSVVLDLKDATDRDRLWKLSDTADVFVESFRPGVAARLGFGDDELRASNPKLIYASISGFGQSGPWADRPGFDLIAQGMAGIMSVTGHPDGEPVKSGVPISDLSAGLYAANGIQAALFARTRTGRGQRVETSLFEAALGLSVWEATEFFATGEPPAPLGSAHRLSAPYQAFRARDGYLTIAALTSLQWEKLCYVLDRADLPDDTRFRTNADRLGNRAALSTEIERSLAARTVDEWVTHLLAEGVPCGPILDYRAVFDSSHTAERQMVFTAEHPVEGQIRTLGVPVKLTDADLRVRRPPPLLGEHTVSVMEAIAAGSSPWESSS